MFKILKDKVFGKKEDTSNTEKKIKLAKSLERNIAIFEDIFANDGTVRFRRMENRYHSCLKCCLISIDGMVNKDITNDGILFPIINSHFDEEIISRNLLDFLSEKIITSNDVRKARNVDDAIGSIIYGDSVLLVEGCSEALIVDTKGWKSKAVGESEAEPVVRGSREGFTEAININLSLLRRRIQTSDLKFMFRSIGDRTNTKVCICYLEGLANEKILNELIKRLDKIKIDGILESGYIEELIRDAPLSVFQTIGNTERPDIVAAKLLEGRIAVFIDGTPFVLTLPFLYMEYFQATEDYYDNFIFASFNRLIRWLGFFLSTSIPAIYIALTTFHQEMMPTPLAISISTARQGVPLPTVVEALIMLIIFAILREAGIRLPKPIGQAASIVGAIVLGDAAVNAKLISAPIVVIVAATGISGFLNPKILGPSVLLRYFLLILSSFLGLYGYIFGVLALTIHLVSIRSFGIPYMSNLGSYNKQDLKDFAIRAPWWYMYFRPKLIGDRDSERKSSAKRIEGSGKK